ncbi:hypothetical protein K503DRAFT_734703 [Rhizopogon vinicolor AM-OR11-026]|uniref:Beta-glucuronidase C-terminal domain-containing protein n=1 Tax=Rhizopogon vinicolor AM-OR11-026 TaxID=1314800 RepID=A0A1B7NAK7_9AGAM|nr:hypothetical protein K503DRAFT_734703 [Rhizopogon vinicolor AM-OR11-026]
MGVMRSFSSRSLLSFVSATLFAFASESLVLGQNTSITVSFPKKPSNAALGNVVQDNFLGISFELSSFDTLWGKDALSMPHAMQNYLSNLRQRFKNPLRIRIGGNSMDGSIFVPDQQDMIEFTDPDAYFNDVPVSFGPMFFNVLNSMADDVGEMQFIIGLSMRDPSEDSNPILLANAAEQMMGYRLDAMLLGNEPDIYANHGTRGNYTIADYIPEVGKVIFDLQNSQYGNLTSNLIIGGPTTCCSWDLDNVLSAGLTQYPYKYYTLQHYPTYICNGPTPQNTNISYFLSHTNVPGFTQWENTGVQMAKDLNVPVLVTEFNTVSCGGSNVSDTFAASLWAIDSGLQFAASNMSAAYLHTREYQVLYNLFDPPTPDTSVLPGWRTGSPYYAALFLAETFISDGTVVLDLNLDNSTLNPESTVAAYGLYDPSSTALRRLVLINYNRSQTQSFSISANITSSIGMRVLSAPTVEERVDIRWAGQIVGPNGDLQGNQTTQYMNCGQGCNVLVPGPGAALVLLDETPDSGGFFIGNSTIAGYPYTAPLSSQSTTLHITISAILVFAVMEAVFWLL